jgi:hypothetical protein
MDRAILLGNRALRKGDTILDTGHPALIRLLNHLDNVLVTGLVLDLLVHSVLGGLHFEFYSLLLNFSVRSLQTHF